jgi:hypothetical protein
MEWYWNLLVALAFFALGVFIGRLPLREMFGHDEE